MTNRILPETLPALYRKHDVVPIQQDYCQLPAAWEEFAPCACGLGISYRDAMGVWPDPQCFPETVAGPLGLSAAYHLGYHHGFDGLRNLQHYMDDQSLESQADYDQGYRDGAAGWQAVKDMAVTG